MCFAVRFKLFPHRRTAKRDIEVYKDTWNRHLVTEVYFESPHQSNFKYKAGKENRIVDLRVSGGKVYYGYHSFINPEPERDEYDRIRDEHRTGSRSSKRTIGVFVIPKGAKYYQNKTQRVSNQLIYKGPLIPIDEHPTVTTGTAPSASV